MPIPTPGPAQVSDAAIQTGSPFWLWINDVWVHLEGVAPEVSVAAERPGSEFMSVDGHRSVFVAPNAPRSWELNYQWATPAAVAALRLAAEVPGEVWLLDSMAAATNMLSARDCYGHDSTAAVLDCGGTPLRALPEGDVASALVRGGVPTTLAAWSSEAEATVLATIGTESLVAPAGSGDRQATVTFTVVADEVLTVDVESGVEVSGLMLTEGTPAPFWLGGERTPCKVAVGDPSQTARRTRPGGLALSEYGVTLREVG